MPNLSLEEIGHLEHSDGETFVITYRVVGLPAGDSCIVGFAGQSSTGQKRWRIDYYRFTDKAPTAVPMPRVLYKSPELALAAIQNRIR
jgi:hypothetical protein